MFPNAVQTDLENIKSLGVITTQEGDVGQNRNCDGFGFGHMTDELGGILPLTHLILLQSIFFSSG
jgi:hypothetical protein